MKCQPEIIIPQKAGGAIVCIQCPKCHLGTISNGVKKNSLLQKLIDLEMPSHKTVCHICGSIAALKCEDCETVLCQLCSPKHNDCSRSLVAYKKCVDELVVCSENSQQPIKFYCKPCNIVICEICKDGSHQNHQCLTVQEAIPTVLDGLEKASYLVNEKIKNYLLQRDALSDIMEEIHNHYAECKKVALAEISNHQKRLLNKKHVLLKEAWSYGGENIEGISKHEHNIEQLSKTVAEEMSKMEDIMQRKFMDEMKKLFIQVCRDKTLVDLAAVYKLKLSNESLLKAITQDLYGKMEMSTKLPVKMIRVVFPYPHNLKNVECKVQLTNTTVKVTKYGEVYKDENDRSLIHNNDNSWPLLTTNV